MIAPATSGDLVYIVWTCGGPENAIRYCERLARGGPLAWWYQDAAERLREAAEGAASQPTKR